MNAATGVTATFTASAPPVKCHVPKVIGKSLKVAKKTLKHANCGLGKVKKAFSKKKKGLVIAQSPKPGKTLSRGAKVSLTLSKGKK
jgi:beta-lactam-binding protein with PASTA domain